MNTTAQGNAYENKVFQLVKKLIEDGDPEANFAHFCLQKFGWEPSKFLDLPTHEQAFVIASIKTRIEAEKKKEAELKAKARKKGKR